MQARATTVSGETLGFTIDGHDHTQDIVVPVQYRAFEDRSMYLYWQSTPPLSQKKKKKMNQQIVTQPLKRNKFLQSGGVTVQ